MPARSDSTGYLVAMLDLGGPFQSAVWDGLLAAAEAERFPYAIELIPPNWPHRLDNPNCIGLVAAVYSLTHARDLAHLPFPVINVSNWAGPVPGLGNLLSDDEAVGRLAARHLLERGYRSLLAVGQARMVNSRERVAGFRQEAEAAGAEVRTIEVPETLPGQQPELWSPQAYLQDLGNALAPTLATLPAEAGVFGVTDWIAGMLERILLARFPERTDTTALLGVDNAPARSWQPGETRGLSSVEPAFRTLGGEALRWMAAHPGDKRAAPRLLRRFAPHAVVERASTAGTACAHPAVARAVRWAWSRLRAGDPPRVADLAALLHTSPRTVERLFATHLGRTARECILAMRIDRAQQLLRDSNRQIGQVAAECGFSKQSIFSAAFRQRVGCSPRNGARQADRPRTPPLCRECPHGPAGPGEARNVPAEPAQRATLPSAGAVHPPPSAR